jgi:hypothetical protein
MCIIIYIYICIYIYIIFFNHSLVVGNLGCFHSLATVKRAVKNMHVQVCFLCIDLHSFGYMPQSGMTDRSIYVLFYEKPQKHSGCTSLHSHQQCMRVFSPPHPWQHLLLFIFLVIVCLPGMRWNLSAVLICISFMTKDAEHFFMCLLAIWISSENCLLNLPIY